MEEVVTKLTMDGFEVRVGDEVLHRAGSSAEADALAAWVRFQLSAGAKLSSVQKMLRGETARDGATSGGIEVAPPPEAKKKEPVAKEEPAKEEPAKAEAEPAAEEKPKRQTRRTKAAEPAKADDAEDKPQRRSRRKKS